MSTAARSPHRDRLLAAVEQIAGTLRAGADDSEDQRRLTPRSLAALRDSGLLAALVPAETGGLQVDPLTELELIEAVSFLDGSTGWTYWALAGSTARAASMLPPTAVAEVFRPGGPVPLIAFQERHFDNRALPTPEGLRVSGQWPFGTGASHADWVLAMVLVDRPTGHGLWSQRAGTFATVVPATQIRIADTWQASGLAGTDTVGYVLDDVLVPWERVWPYPVEGPERGGAHFCFRRAPIKHTGFALGLARSSLTLMTDHLTRRAAAAPDRPVGGLPTDLARATFAHRSAHLLAMSTVEQVWAEARDRGEVTDASQDRLRAMARHVTEVALQVCGLAARYGDASLLARQHPVQRNLRDLVAGASHAEVDHTALHQHGAALLGLPG